MCLPKYCNIRDHQTLLQQNRNLANSLATCNTIKSECFIDKGDVERKLATCIATTPDCETCEYNGRPAPIVPPDPPSEVWALSREDQEVILVRDCGRCQIFMPDDAGKEPCNLVLKRTDLYLWVLWVGVYKQPYIMNKRDCEQFTGALRHAAFGYPTWEEVASWDCLHRFFGGGHSGSVWICRDDLGDNEFHAFFVEPQMDAETHQAKAVVQLATAYFGTVVADNPYMLYGAG